MAVSEFVWIRVYAWAEASCLLPFITFLTVCQVRQFELNGYKSFINKWVYQCFTPTIYHNNGSYSLFKISSAPMTSVYVTGCLLVSQQVISSFFTRLASQTAHQDHQLFCHNMTHFCTKGLTVQKKRVKIIILIYVAVDEPVQQNILLLFFTVMTNFSHIGGLCFVFYYYLDDV